MPHRVRGHPRRARACSCACDRPRSHGERMPRRRAWSCSCPAGVRGHPHAPPACVVILGEHAYAATRVIVLGVTVSACPTACVVILGEHAYAAARVIVPIAQAAARTRVVARQNDSGPARTRVAAQQCRRRRAHASLPESIGSGVHRRRCPSASAAAHFRVATHPHQARACLEQQ